MKTIGLIGGIASGKTLVAAEFARLGAGILDADRAAHAALDAPNIRDAIVARWGTDVLTSDGTVGRSAVARRVFALPPDGPRNRQFLEKLIHPRARQIIEQERAGMAARGVPAVVVDAPLLLEAGWDAFCDAVVFVDAPVEVRSRRAAARGWSADELPTREATQIGIEAKRGRADAVIDNGGPVASTREQVKHVWDQLTGNS
jgi:dephospho-CoA kinase